jgi:hypothetical protein
MDNAARLAQSKREPVTICDAHNSFGSNLPQRIAAASASYCWCYSGPDISCFLSRSEPPQLLKEHFSMKKIG